MASLRYTELLFSSFDESIFKFDRKKGSYLFTPKDAANESKKIPLSIQSILEPNCKRAFILIALAVSQ